MLSRSWNVSCFGKSLSSHSFLVHLHRDYFIKKKKKKHTRVNSHDEMKHVSAETECKKVKAVLPVWYGILFALTTSLTLNALSYLEYYLINCPLAPQLRSSCYDQ